MSLQSVPTSTSDFTISTASQRGKAYGILNYVVNVQYCELGFQRETII